MHLSQPKYIDELVSKANLSNSKPVATPLYKPADESHEAFDNPQLFRQLLGGLQYLHMTRPDISYATNQLAKAMHNTTVDHWTKLERVLLYLKGTTTQGIMI
ncbi:Retrovirus-related Pol polyprotein from transposon RE2 [Linum perenne]